MDTSTVILIVVFSFVSLFLGAIVAWLFSQNRSRGISEQLRIELAQHKAKISELENDIANLQPEYEQLQVDATNLRIKMAELPKFGAN